MNLINLLVANNALASTTTAAPVLSCRWVNTLLIAACVVGLVIAAAGMIAG